MAVTPSPTTPGGAQPPTPTFAPAAPILPSVAPGTTSLGEVPDWVAALIGYGVLLLMGETSFGGLAVILAWGIALSEVLTLAGNQQSPLLGLFKTGG